MAKFTFNVSEDKVDDILEAFKGLFPIPDENVGTEEEPDMQPAYTDAEWAKQCIKNYVVNTVKRYQQTAAIKAAKDGVSVADDVVTYE